MFKILTIILAVLLILHSQLLTHHSFARTTPEEIVTFQREAYQKKVSRYSLDNKQKLEKLEKKIAEVNKKRADELKTVMDRQAAILDEYQKRQGQAGQGVEYARYWLTYAHEAVAFQAAKIYIFDLTGEGNIKKDAQLTISQLESDLETLKTKIIKSQNILKNLVKK